MAFKVSRDVDTAGGDLIPSSSDIFVEDELIILDGDAVKSHGDNAHSNATVDVTFTSDVFGNDEKVAVEFSDSNGTGDKATCGHKLTASQSTVTVNVQ
jgi:hypothetical protein